MDCTVFILALLSCEYNKVVSDIYFLIEFSVDLETSVKSTQLNIMFKFEIKVIIFSWKKQDI